MLLNALVNRFCCFQIENLLGNATFSLQLVQLASLLQNVASEVTLLHNCESLVPSLQTFPDRVTWSGVSAMLQ